MNVHQPDSPPSVAAAHPPASPTPSASSPGTPTVLPDIPLHTPDPGPTHPAAQDPVPEPEPVHEPQPARDDLLHPPEPITPGLYLGLPSLTPSKSTGSASSSSPPDSILDDDGGFPDHHHDDEDAPDIDQLDALSLVDPVPPSSSSSEISHLRKKQKKKPAGLGPCTPAHPPSQSGTGSRSEPGPTRRSIGRKRSVSGLVALRYRTSGQMDSDQRGMLALDLDAYINSSDHRDGTTQTQKPSTAALSPVALFPTLLNRPTTVLPHRSEWVVGTGTGPGNAHRGFIPGVLSDSS